MTIPVNSTLGTTTAQAIGAIPGAMPSTQNPALLGNDDFLKLLIAQLRNQDPLNPHLEELRAPLLDPTIEVLSTKPLEQLLGPERDPLREELKKRFNAVLGHPAVTHVYTEFLVQ